MAVCVIILIILRNTYRRNFDRPCRGVCRKNSQDITSWRLSRSEILFTGVLRSCETTAYDTLKLCYPHYSPRSGFKVIQTDRGLLPLFSRFCSLPSCLTVKSDHGRPTTTTYLLSLGFTKICSTSTGPTEDIMCDIVWLRFVPATSTEHTLLKNNLRWFVPYQRRT